MTGAFPAKFSSYRSTYSTPPTSTPIHYRRNIYKQNKMKRTWHRNPDDVPFFFLSFKSQQMKIEHCFASFVLLIAFKIVERKNWIDDALKNFCFLGLY